MEPFPKLNELASGTLTYRLNPSDDRLFRIVSLPLTSFGGVCGCHVADDRVPVSDCTESVVFPVPSSILNNSTSAVAGDVLFAVADTETLDNAVV